MIFRMKTGIWVVFEVTDLGLLGALGDSTLLLLVWGPWSSLSTKSLFLSYLGLITNYQYLFPSKTAH